ncbi:MAG: TIM barrel protein [Christensenellaceae bacterium]
MKGDRMGIRFGPAGNSDAFVQEGYKHTFQAPKWISDKGLDAFEYSFGRGVKLKEETGEKIAQEAQKYDVQISAHAPYFINLANDDEDKFEKNLSYFRETSVAARYLHAKRVVFHPGSCAKMDRNLAFENVKRNLSKIIRILKDDGFGDLLYCAETMGKMNQIGTLEEICELAGLAENLYPAIDFGHLNARTLGKVATSQDYETILDTMQNTIGTEKTKNMHVHFSHIQYTTMGEKMHLTFEDTQYGPFFEPFAPILVKRNATPVIICESKGTQAQDAAYMKKLYEEAKK